MNFIGILDGSDLVWGVRVPDVPGANGGGRSPYEAIESAIGALYDLGTEGTIPRTAEEIAADPNSEFDPHREALVVLRLDTE